MSHTTAILATRITEYAEQLRLNGRTEITVKSVTSRLKLLAKKCDINNPYEVKETLANLKWQNSTKHTAVIDYTGYLKFIGKTWDKPRYTPQEKIIFIPTESEIDQLISASGKTLAPLLQFLKETAARIGEAVNVKWIDIDNAQKTVAINHPEKGSLPRLIPISEKLIAMINSLEKTSEYIFTATTTQHGLRITFEAMRKRTAKKLNNPRLNRIHFHTFRHWKATTTFLKMKDGYYVRQLLGHKTATMTDRYIHIATAMLTNKEEEWICKTAITIKEAQALIETGFEYITDMEGIKLFKKRK